MNSVTLTFFTICNKCKSVNSTRSVLFLSEVNLKRDSGVTRWCSRFRVSHDWHALINCNNKKKAASSSLLSISLFFTALPLMANYGLLRWIYTPRNVNVYSHKRSLVTSASRECRSLHLHPRGSWEAGYILHRHRKGMTQEV